VPSRKTQPATTPTTAKRRLRTPPAPTRKVTYPGYDAQFHPDDAIVAEGPAVLQPSRLAYRDDARGLWLYHGDCLEVMDHLLAKPCYL
jgi:hypothetical protein